MKYSKKELLSIPNILGYFRLLLIPVFCFFFIRGHGKSDYTIAAVIIAISTMTDFCDGFIARKFNMITDFGKVLDPVADKLTHGAIAICLVFRYPMMLYLVILMVVKEGFMAVAGAYFIKKQGKALDGAMYIGKVCTATLFVLLFALVLFPSIPHGVVTLLIIAEMVLMLITLLSYIRTYGQMMKKLKEKQQSGTR